MKVIRRCVFETNSSSTHSISIYKWTPTKEFPIPKNENINIKGEISNQTEIKDELGKLKYIICMLASNAENNEDYFIDEKDKISYIGSNYPDKYFQRLINDNTFIWLKELIKEKYNTEINYIRDNDSFPYYETVCDDYLSIREVLNCDLKDEKSFKNRISEIIFDENIIIEDKETEN